jgi:hypothetical protein
VVKARTPFCELSPNHGIFDTLAYREERLSRCVLAGARKDVNSFEQPTMDLSSRLSRSLFSHSMPRDLKFCASPFSLTRHYALPSQRTISQPIHQSSRYAVRFVSYGLPLFRAVDFGPQSRLALPTSSLLSIGEGVFAGRSRLGARKLVSCSVLAIRLFHSSLPGLYDRLQNLEDAANRDRDNANAQAVFLQVRSRWPVKKI